MSIRCPPQTGQAGSGVGQGFCLGAGFGLGSFFVILVVYRIYSPGKVDEVADCGRADIFTSCRPTVILSRQSVLIANIREIRSATYRR